MTQLPPTPPEPPAPGPAPSGTPPPSAQWTAPPAYSAPYPQPRSARVNGLAIVSLISGILFCFFVTPVVAVVTGQIALEQIADSEGASKGRGMAIAGATLGWIFLSLALLGVAGWVISLLAA
jgi:hypothetical protein